jgi:copper transport protein
MARTRSQLQTVTVALAAVFLLTARTAGAHARLRSASPADGAQLDRAPQEITLTFTEPVEAALSTVTLRDPAGSRLETVRGRIVPGDRRSCVASLPQLQPGAYVVEWRVVSVDGHAMTGSYTFTIRGVEPHQSKGGPPPSAAAPPPSAPPPSSPTPAVRASRREMAARWLFITGVAALLGAAAASVGGFGGHAEMALAAVGWITAFVGVALLAEAQRRTAGTTFDALLRTSLGTALVSRAAALLGAGVCLIAARISAARRRYMSFALVLALVAIGLHVAAGHAAAVERFTIAAIALQWVHFAAAGVWLGGLAALLAGTRGEPDAAKTTAVHRYSSLAGIAIATVAVTGILRTVQELSSWNQLVSTDYGQAALAKAMLLLAIAALGALNRWHSVPAAATNLHPLRRFAMFELVLMVVVLGVAAILATLPPPG